MRKDLNVSRQWHRYSLGLLLVTVLFLVFYFEANSQTAATWLWASNMPATFTPRQIVAEIWCVAFLLGASMSGLGASITELMSRSEARRERTAAAVLGLMTLLANPLPPSEPLPGDNAADPPTVPATDQCLAGGSCTDPAPPPSVEG